MHSQVVTPAHIVYQNLLFGTKYGISGFELSLVRNHKLRNIKAKIENKIIKNAVRNAQIALDKHAKISAKNLGSLKKIQEFFSKCKSENRTN